jgi:hypothetical protein
MRKQGCLDRAFVFGFFQTKKGAASGNILFLFAGFRD